MSVIRSSTIAASVAVSTSPDSPIVIEGASSMKNMRHGNFHFHHGDLIEFKKQGNLLLSLRDLEFVYSLLAILSLQEGKDEDYYWRKFNSDIQKVIDDKLAEIEPLIEWLPRQKEQQS